ncbi:MAG: hypothetical protein N3E44_08040 [Candidatus Bathyarchaeota archaeon]|nr:hypothetical protein [Candidatus Bathyarchaeota archaeon]
MVTGSKPVGPANLSNSKLSSVESSLDRKRLSVTRSSINLERHIFGRVGHIYTFKVWFRLWTIALRVKLEVRSRKSGNEAETKLL